MRSLGKKKQQIFTCRCSLSLANLFESNLTGANLTGAFLTEAILTRVKK
jgi:uncharacterized protein YjbI with pentapeptide repeats